MAARFRLAIQWVAPSICRKLSKFNPSRDRRRRSSSKIFDDGFLDRGVPEAPRIIWDAVASENQRIVRARRLRAGGRTGRRRSAGGGVSVAELVLCLKRIRKSIGSWTKEGADHAGAE